MSIDPDLALSPPLAVADAAAGSFLGVPALPGVLCVLDAGGGVVTLAATGDLRRWARVRLDAAEATARRTTDLASIATTLRWATAGSDVESDWLYLELGRRLIPQTYRAAADRWQAWYIRLDPADAAPAWRKGRVEEFAAAGTAWGTLIGPFRDKDAAGRFGELLDDLFELCRYPKELALAPAGTPCAYKQMGRCPAPCDGSEPMEAFRVRVGEALGFARDPGRWCAGVEASMRAAAAAMDFEGAARSKALLDRGARASHRAFAWATTLDHGRWAFIGPSERAGWARLILAGPGRFTPIADVDAGDPPACLALLCEMAEVPAEAGALGPEGLDRAGLLAHALYHRPAKARGGFIALHRPPDPAEVTRLLRSVARAEPSDPSGHADLPSTENPINEASDA